MTRVCVLALLLAAYTCVAQPQQDADLPRAPLLGGSLLRVAGGQQRLEPAVSICLVTNPNRLIVSAAETIASQMFAAIRVRLRWYGAPVCPGDAVVVTVMTSTSEAYFPRALGVALPLEGSHAWVFYDRVLWASPDDVYLAALLAHVMAHEIGHVLEGVIRHSESGILKAHWSGTDCARMASFPLMFAREDTILIHHGLKERRQRLISGGSAGVQINRYDEMWARKERSLPAP